MFKNNYIKYVSKIIIFLLLLNNIQVYCQTYEIDEYDGQTVYTCSGIFYDSGGNSGNYGNNENYTVTFCSFGGENLSFRFTEFSSDWDFGSQTDYLKIYDGPNTSSPAIGGLFYYNLGTPFTINSSGPYLTFSFTSDGSTTKSGWSAEISCFTIPGDVQYHVNGTGEDNGNNCYTITQDMEYANGSIWYSEQLNLAEPFDIEFNMNFGANDGGADGMAFVMQQIGVNALGNIGGGLGYGGTYFQPSFGIEFDTFENFQHNDPAEDHIAFSRDGNIDHANANNIAGPVQANLSDVNIEDDTDYPIRITWAPSTNTLEIYFNCELRLSTQYDITNSVFGGNPLVYWGFTAGTGIYSNEQKVCLKTNILNVPDDLIICYGDSAQLDATGTVFSSYLWGPDYHLSSTTIQDPVASPDVTTTYYVTVTEPVCGFQKVDSITVFVTPLPDISITGDSVICIGDTVTFVASGGDSYIWNTGSTDNYIEDVPLSTTTYIVTVTQDGCSGTGSVTVYPIPVLSISGDTVVCLGESDTLTASGGDSYIWSTGDTGGQITVTPDENITYYVTVTQDGCSDIGSISVDVLPSPTVTISGQDSICRDDEATIVFDLTGMPPWEMTYSNGILYYPETINTSTFTLSVNLSQNTTYTVTMLEDQNGCSATDLSDTHTVYILPTPEADAGADIAECGLSEDLDANPSIGTGTWSTTSDAVIGPDIHDPEATAEVTTYGSYIFTWTEVYNTCSDTDHVEAVFYEQPMEPDAGDDQYLICEYETTLDAGHPVIGIGAWSISQGSGVFQDINDPLTTVTGLPPGSNIFIWTITNGICVPVSDNVMVTVTDLIIPSGFSPNGDNINDLFYITGLEYIEKSELTIFNRWGIEIYKDTDFQNNWNGINNNGEELPDDTYFYILKAGDLDPYTGYVVIKK